MSRRLRQGSTTVLLIAFTAILTACGALQPPSADGPRVNEAPYPILMSNEADRTEAATLAWQRLSERNGLSSTVAPSFQPLTATVKSLPATETSSILLPKVGTDPIANEDDTREALRRFIVEWRQLIGAEPSQLSLVERIDETSGIKVARYEQHPFRYPLRGEFGKLVIRFRNDRRVVGLSSNCLPNSDRAQAALLGLNPKVTREDVPTLLQGNVITVNVNGREQNLTLSNNNSLDAQQLVVYALGSQESNAIELHLAWEIDVTNGPIKTIYLDAINGKVIASS
jgi:hypothetical protein